MQVTDLEPRLVWKNFAALSAIPRCSGHEEAAARFVLDWAAERGLEARQDAVGNVVVRVPASPGLDDRPTVVLQGHLDMVCEKNADVDHDFTRDPIRLKVDGDFVTAEGTTLGADNGLGVASAMAVAEDPDAVHGPLEILCTIDEERGLTGAASLEPGFVTGRTLLNLDTEELGALYVGCAGGGDVVARWRLPLVEAPAGTVGRRVAVRGLAGGHSGMDIIENRGNALKFALRLLDRARRAGIPVDLGRFEGGSKRNAIPREAWADVAVPAEQAEAFAALAAELAAELRAAFPTDPDLALTVTEAEVPRVAADPRAMLAALLAAPSGVLAMSRDVPGLVETSNNLGVVRWEADGALARVEAVCASRSSVGSELEATRDALRALFEHAGASVLMEASYPGWKPNLDSPVLALSREVHAEVLGAAPEVKAVHAGLECGLIGERYPGLDMISFGPDVEGAHSPDERVRIASVAPFYAFLKALLARLAA